MRTWLKVLLIGLIVLVIAFSTLSVIFGGREYSLAYGKALQFRNISECENIPSYKYMITSQTLLFSSRRVPSSIENQRENCKYWVETTFGHSGERLQQYSDAVNNNKPEDCPETGAFECLDDIRNKYQDPSVCSYYVRNNTKVDHEYQKYMFIFDCQAYFITIGKQTTDYCNQFEGEIKDYCLIRITQQYNTWRKRLYLSTTPNIPEICHQKDNTTILCVPNICDREEDFSLKELCNYFNYW